MLQTGPRTVVFLCAMTMIFLGGCSSQRAVDERNQFWRENQQLKSELAKHQQQSQIDRANYTNEVRRLQGELDTEKRRKQLKPIANVTAVANQGFGGIAGVEVIRDRDRVTVRVPGDVLFSPGLAELKSTSKKTLDRVAAEIKRSYPGNVVRIEGYTDSDKIRKSSWKDNLDLSLARAGSVHRYLATRGVDAKRMYAAGFGSAKPRSSKAKSRRVEIVVVLNE